MGFLRTSFYRMVIDYWFVEVIDGFGIYNDRFEIYNDR